MEGRWPPSAVVDTTVQPIDVPVRSGGFGNLARSASGTTVRMNVDDTPATTIAPVASIVVLWFVLRGRCGGRSLRSGGRRSPIGNLVILTAFTARVGGWGAESEVVMVGTS